MVTWPACSAITSTCRVRRTRESRSHFYDGYRRRLHQVAITEDQWPHGREGWTYQTVTHHTDRTPSVLVGSCCAGDRFPLYLYDCSVASGGIAQPNSAKLIAITIKISACCPCGSRLEPVQRGAARTRKRTLTAPWVAAGPQVVKSNRSLPSAPATPCRAT